ncbi:MAG: hypothetical protein ACYCZ6_10500 [Polaromonas sp.]
MTPFDSAGDCRASSHGGRSFVAFSLMVCGMPVHNHAINPTENVMAKGQQNNKMVKKPKKDTSPSKPVSPDAIRPTIVTQVPLRGKLKK